MNIVVCIKQTFDTEAKIVLDGSGKIDPNGVNLIINTYDEFAVEEGIKLKEKFGGEVTVVSMGSSRATKGKEKKQCLHAKCIGTSKENTGSTPYLSLH